MVIVYTTICHGIGLFTSTIQHLVEHHPRLYCALFSPWFFHAITIYLMYLAFVKLLMVVSMERFVNLNHEDMAFKLNIAAAFTVTADFLFKLNYHEHFVLYLFLAVTFQPNLVSSTNIRRKRLIYDQKFKSFALSRQISVEYN